MMLIPSENTLLGKVRQDYQMPHFAFVDVDNLKESFFKKLCDLGIDESFHHQFKFEKLFEFLSHDRIYAYSAVEEGAELPGWLQEIRSQSGVVLKLGVLTRKSGRRKQEGVDVKLAIEATRLAYTKTMRTCTLYGADGDFIPLVEALSESGCIVEVASFNNPQKGRVAPILQAASDRYIQINGPWLNLTQRDFAEPVSQSLGDFHRVTAAPTHKVETIHGEKVEIKKLGNKFYSTFNGSSPRSVQTCSSYDDLINWAKLNFEPA